MPDAPAKKTFEEHREYLRDIVRLQLWFAWQHRSSLRDFRLIGRPVPGTAVPGEPGKKILESRRDG